MRGEGQRAHVSVLSARLVRGGAAVCRRTTDDEQETNRIAPGSSRSPGRRHRQPAAGAEGRSGSRRRCRRFCVGGRGHRRTGRAATGGGRQRQGDAANRASAPAAPAASARGPARLPNRPARPATPRALARRNRQGAAGRGCRASRESTGRCRFPAHAEPAMPRRREPPVRPAARRAEPVTVPPEALAPEHDVAAVLAADHRDPFAFFGMHRFGGGRWRRRRAAAGPGLRPRRRRGRGGRCRQRRGRGRPRPRPRGRPVRRRDPRPHRALRLPPARRHSTRARSTSRTPTASRRSCPRPTPTCSPRAATCESYKRLGAHPLRLDGVDGVAFAVWAPHAAQGRGHRRVQRLGRPPPRHAPAPRMRGVGDLHPRRAARASSTSTRSRPPAARC